MPDSTPSNPPNGSYITKVVTDNSATYSWKQQRHFFQWYAIFAGAALILMGSVFVPLMSKDMADQFDMPGEVRLVMSAFFILPGLLNLYFGLRKLSEESIQLSGHQFRYDIGPTIFPRILMFMLQPAVEFQSFMRIQNPTRFRRDLVDCTATEIGPFTVERIAERQRLRFDQGVERIEVGMMLREPEREWLEAELSAWQQLHS